MFTGSMILSATQPWVPSANRIPAMTSATTPSGVVTCSSELSVNWAAWMAFNQVNTGLYNQWLTNGTTTGWVVYDFGTGNGFIARQYTVQASNTVDWHPRTMKTWTFEGWNGSTWDVLDTQGPVAAWTQGLKRTYPFANATSYEKYRWNITASQATDYTGAGELEIMS